MGLLDNLNLENFRGRAKYKKGRGKHEIELKLGEDKEDKNTFCYHCRKKIKEEESVGACNVEHFSIFLKILTALFLRKPSFILCSNCAKRCKKCERIYCPIHIKNHRC